MSHTFLNYRTYDQLLAEIQSDFKKFYLEDLINPQEFIKVAKKCNSELGLKVFKTKEVVLDIERGRAKLPNTFNVLNFAFMLSSHFHIEPLISGTHTERVNLGPTYDPGTWTDPLVCSTDPEPTVVPATACNACGSSFTSCACKPVGDVELNCSDSNYSVLIQRFKYHTKKWTSLSALRIINSPDVVDINCPNKTWQSPNTAYIKNGFIYTSFKTGKLYLNFQGMMEDEEGNLLIPDHDLLNDFYEYAIKRRVLENAVMNGENVTQLQIQLIEQNFRAARNNAFSYVNTPDFGELRRIWEVNRKAQYHNFYNMFKSY